MANFMIPHNAKRAEGEDVSTFDLPLGRTLTLLQWGGDSGGNKLVPTVVGKAAPVHVDVLPDKIPAASTLFKVTGNTAPASAKIAAFVLGTARNYSESLTINVLPEARKHPTYAVDLVSEMATKGDARRVALYSRLMKNPDPLVGQDMGKAKLDCGDVAATYGGKLFGKKTDLTINAYFTVPSTKTKLLADLRFDPVRMKATIAKLQNLLNHGISARVEVVFRDGFNVGRSMGTHFVTLVGYGGNKFLSIDPLPGFSKFPYDGGMYPSKPPKVPHFGQFEFDPGRLDLGIRSSASSGAFYIVVAGP